MEGFKIPYTCKAVRYRLMLNCNVKLKFPIYPLSEATRVPRSQEQKNQPRIADCLVIFATVIVAALPYLPGLGFYSDDWSTIADFSNHGTSAVIREMLTPGTTWRLRPVQIAFLSLTYNAFHLHALPYHILITLSVGVSAVFAYLAINELQVGRWVAFSIAVVFGLLPHYSSDNIWIASHVAVLSVTFALAGVYSMLRAARVGEKRWPAWAICAALAMALSILSYEIAFGIIAASVVLLGWKMYERDRASSQRFPKRLAGVVSMAAVLLLLVAVKVHEQTRIVYHGHFFGHFWKLIWHALSQAVLFNFWTYGLHLPVVLADLYRQSALSIAAAIASGVVFVLVTAYLWRCMDPLEVPRLRTCLWLILISFVVFALGYGLFLPVIDANFSSAGVANRVTMASALGAACVPVAIAGLICWLISPLLRHRVFSVVMGLICAVNCLVMCGIGHYWDDAASQQAAVLASIKTNVRSLPHDSVLLLDGVCRYSGPAVVFEVGYDIRGALATHVERQVAERRCHLPESAFSRPCGRQHVLRSAVRPLSLRRPSLRLQRAARVSDRSPIEGSGEPLSTNDGSHRRQRLSGCSRRGRRKSVLTARTFLPVSER